MITSLSCNRNDERVSHIDEIKKENIILSKNFKIISSQRISGGNIVNSPLENVRLENDEEYKLPSNFSNTTDNIIKYSFDDKRYNLYEFNIKHMSYNKEIIGFYFTNNEKKDGFIIYKEVLGNKVSFYDENFVLLYSYEINNGKIVSFINYDSKFPSKKYVSKPNERMVEMSGCYKKCRDKYHAELESDFLSDLACSINPCGAMVAIYCKGKCEGWW